ncbi:MAG: hypothetical protein ABTD50_20680 [Polyangiaceae bacterium]|jgi:hypothetical protein
MRAASIALAICVALAGGCTLITGSTDGYSLVASAGSAPCTSASSCGDAGLCCLVVASSSISTGGTCLPSCSVAFPQLCATDAECGHVGPCTQQTCVIDGGGGLAIPLAACGTVPGCAASQ